MSPARAFWEYPDFWPMIAVILIFALLSALCIALGPDEYGSGEDQDEVQR